ncbi:iron-containing alcohol dehydrogenase [Microbulbifer sp. OS29]|uniref:Iron-containing alcohol dehydrogenase n=1 Tax=Microbulbifer okhotskensis TaxID=2926617 RepID=A0A9X2EMN5_9GAMM|nr:Gfo/Idh/MocA family oxidoreductase [Microbulbifer okhotskensis]MCO1334405.1 iron-containing alcohol dehydrogenase [Microbulbifer okhotskensis]
MEYTDMTQNKVHAIVVGVGLPGESIGWLHLSQLIKMPNVIVDAVVEEYWLGNTTAPPAKQRVFREEMARLMAHGGGFDLYSSVEDIPIADPSVKNLVLISVRTPLNMKIFEAVAEKEYKNIYLEKPGEDSLDKLQAMVQIADEKNLRVVVGYQKHISSYVKKAEKITAGWKLKTRSVSFVHHNPHSEDNLENIFRQNTEGMLLNQCCHELELCVAKWNLQPHNIVDIVVNREETERKRFGDIEDFKKLSFTLKTNLGISFSFLVTRCEGVENSITVKEGLTGNPVLIELAPPGVFDRALDLAKEEKGAMWYCQLFEEDYHTLKNEFVESILNDDEARYLNLPGLKQAVSVLLLATSIETSILAQCSEDEAHHPIVQILDTVCQTPTSQRIWYHCNLFSPGNRFLVDILRPPRNRIICCVDDKVWQLYSGLILEWERSVGVEFIPIVMTGGEQSKNINSFHEMIDEIWKVNPIRYREPIVALGGGAVTDTIGFVSAVWRRNTPWIRIPTTLMGMIDSSIGIKVSVNHNIKNGIGAFHCPLHTIIDPTFLKTNPQRVLKSAVGEMVKVGLVFNKDVLDCLSDQGDSLLHNHFLGEGGVPGKTSYNLILNCIDAMIDSIGGDLQEENLSRPMDFGHTLSRWLERDEAFRLMHGEAVGIDCLFTSLVAEQMGLISTKDVDLLFGIYTKLGLAANVKGLNLDVYKTALEQISIHRSGSLRAPLPSPLGNCIWVEKFESRHLEQAWNNLQNRLTHHHELILDPDTIEDEQRLTTLTEQSKPQTQEQYSSHKLRWGFIGCGRIANDFAKVVNYLDSAEIHAVASRNLDKARAFADKYGVEKAYGNYAELVNDPDVDVVYVATIPELHWQHTQLALNANKHVLVEKPLALTVEDAIKIKNLAQEKQLFCMEGLWMRFFPVMEYCKSLIGQGVIGRICQLRADLSFDLRKDEGMDSPKWKVGAGMDAGVYPVHAAIMVLGRGTSDLEFSGVLDDYGFREDASGLIYAHFGSGPTAVVSWSHLVEGAEELEIYGTDGRIKVHSPAHCPTQITVTRIAGDRRMENDSQLYEFPLPRIRGEFNYPNSEGLYYEARAVQRCIDRKLTECPELPLADSIQAIRMILECDRYIKRRVA